MFKQGGNAYEKDKKNGGSIIINGMKSDNKFANAAARGMQHAFNGAKTTDPEMNGMSSLQQKAFEALRMDDMAENGLASHWSYKGIKREDTVANWHTGGLSTTVLSY